MRDLIIGGITVPLRASERLTVDLRPVQAVSRPRMSDGSLKQQESWTGKNEISIKGEGVIPAGLDGLNYSASIIIKSIEDKAITSDSNVITVPSGRRADYGVEGRAIVGNNLVITPVALAGDEATLTVVAGATQYQAIYWPEFNCYCDPPTQNGTVRGARHGWSLEGEQI